MRATGDLIGRGHDERRAEAAGTPIVIRLSAQQRQAQQRQTQVHQVQQDKRKRRKRASQCAPMVVSGPLYVYVCMYVGDAHVVLRRRREIAERVNQTIGVGGDAHLHTIS